MNKSKTIIALIALTLSISLSAQVAPTTGEKVLEVKESYSGEYLQIVNQGNLSDVVVKAITERIPKKIAKYGFSDITISEVGQVPSPENWTDKLAKSSGLNTNRAKGENMLKLASTTTEIIAAINKMYEPDGNEGNWKFQVNFIDNVSKETYKVRINMMYNPIYIIKKSDLIKDTDKS